MRDVTASRPHVRDAENGSDEPIELTTDDAVGTTRADGDAASTGGSGWLPTLAVQAPEIGPRWGLWGGLIGVVVLLVAGGVMSTRLPGGTTLAGSEISSVANAPAALAAAAEALESVEVVFLTEAGGRAAATGAELGLAVDAEASVAPVRNGLPALELWARRLRQGPQALPVVATAPEPSVLDEVAAAVSVDPVNAEVQVRRAGVDVTPGQDGLRASAGDVDAALDPALSAITTSPPETWPTTIEVRVGGAVEPPPVTQADIDAVTAVIDRVETAEVGLTARTADPPGEEDDSSTGEERVDNRIELTGADLRTLVDVEPAPDEPPGERLQLVPDIAAPSSRVVALLELARVPPVMTARIENRSPTPDPGPDEELTDVSTISGDVVAGEAISPGFEPDREATLADVIEAALDGGGEVRVSGTEDLTPSPADMGIFEPVSTFTTFFPAGQSRVQNIQRMADIVDGTVIQAGQSYELNDAVGRRTIDNGFTLGGAIIDGELVSDVGGGVSQFATTFFNAAWFAGVELVDWKAHSIYFPRYPAGREATVNYPNVNLEIRNDTPYAILVDATYTDSSVTVTFWSTPHWEVETISGPCACGGSFSINVDRIRTAPGGAPIEETWTTSYTVPR